MILADTSAWVEFLRATNSEVHTRLRALLVEGSELATTEPVLMEVLAGARDKREATRLRSLLFQPTLISVDRSADFDAAAAIYRACRNQGVTPRALMDCLIAAIASRNVAAVLTGDADLRRIAGVIGSQLDLA